jgi:hypothetical protein
MDKRTRRSLLKPKLGLAGGAAGAAGASEALGEEGISRKALLQGTAGAAAGAAVILATPKVAAVAIDAATPSAPAASPEPAPVAITPSSKAPGEPITAFVRDAERGEVTVMSGQQETTYRDPALVKRLLKAAR